MTGLSGLIVGLSFAVLFGAICIGVLNVIEWWLHKREK